MICPRCQHDVPATSFCIRCGEPLDRGPEPAGNRRAEFAASPGEPASAVAVISTLFPQLPRADLDTFRLALAGGVILLMVVALLGAFPVALAGSAVLVPLLMVLYMYSVDVYEDTPRPVLAAILGGLHGPRATAGGT